MTRLKSAKWYDLDPNWPGGKEYGIDSGPGFQLFADGRYEITPTRPRGYNRFAVAWLPMGGDAELLAWNVAGMDCVHAIYEHRRKAGRGVMTEQEANQ